MTEHILFLTGHLAEPRLKQVVASMAPTDFTAEVRNVGVKVAALMTPEIVRRRIGPLDLVIRTVRSRGYLLEAASETGQQSVALA